MWDRLAVPMVLGGSPLVCMPEGPGAFIFVMKIKYLAREGRVKKQCIRKVPLLPKTCSDSTHQELAFKKKIKIKKITNPASRGLALQPSWSLPLLFLWKQRVGRHLGGYGVPRGSRLCHPFPLLSLERQGFFYTENYSCPYTN